jgi:hypothetical protein
MSLEAVKRLKDRQLPQRSEVKQELLKLLKTSIKKAWEAGGIDIMLSLAERNGVPLAASCLGSYVEQGDEVPVDQLLAEASMDGGDVTCMTSSAVPQYGAAMVMATGFANLQEAGMWRPVLDELASAVGLKGES